MKTETRRIAINFGGGYAPGLNAVVTGAVLAARGLGWDIVGIRDGFDGLLFPDRYPEGGLMGLVPGIVRNLAGTGGCILGTGARSDPFHVRSVNADNIVEELDRSDELLALVQKEDIDAVISVVSPGALGILLKMHRKGLKTVCIPKSVENDVEGTMLSFGFNSTLSFVAEMLERTRQAAQSSQKIGVVEVLGKHAGWLALQAGIAVCADAVLMPEIPYDLGKVATALQGNFKAGRTSGLVVVAEGARPLAEPATASRVDAGVKATLSPGATGGSGSHVIDRSGRVAEEVALELQRLTDRETYPLVLGQLAKAGAPTVVDRQLGLSYGAAAVRAIAEGRDGVMVAFQAPDVKFIPLAEAINRVRAVPVEGGFVQTARCLGISLGD